MKHHKSHGNRVPQTLGIASTKVADKLLIDPTATSKFAKTSAVKTCLAVTIFLACTASEANSQSPVYNERPALPFPNGISLFSQCGQVDDLQDVELYDGTLGVAKSYVDTHEKSTIQLQWLSETSINDKLPNYDSGNVPGQRWCTATLIGPARALTAGHCFDIGRGDLGWLTPYKRNALGQPEFASPNVLATLFVANFGFQIASNTGDLRQPDVFPISKLIEYREGPNDLDYAIVELGPNTQGKLPADVGHEIAALDVRDVGVAELLAIIQHPQGDPKKIEAGNAQQTADSNLYYDNIDTHGGSSGSSVRDSDGDVVAVHTNGGCVPGGGGANRGVLLKAISAVSPSL